MTEPTVSRRGVVATGAGVLAALAGCTTDGEGSGDGGGGGGDGGGNGGSTVGDTDTRRGGGSGSTADTQRERTDREADTTAGAETEGRDTPGPSTVTFDSVSVDDTWPSFAGGPGNHGAVAAAGPESSMEQVWNAPGGSPAGLAVRGKTGYYGDTGGHVRAVTTAHGNQAWTKRPWGDDAAVRAVPAVMDTRVVVTAHTSGGGAVATFDAQDGSVSWSQSTSAPTVGSPSVDGDRAYVCVAAERDEVRALGLSDGGVAWTASPGTPRATPAVAGGRVFVAVSSAVVALDAATGSELWRVDVGGPVTGAPTAYGGAVFVGTSGDGGGVVAVSGDGARVWTAAVGSVRGSPAVRDETVYAATTDGSVYELDGATGRRGWSGNAGSPVAKSLCVTDSSVVAATTTGGVVGLSRESGLRHWSAPLPSYAQSASNPVVVGDTLFVDDTANMRAYR